MWYIYFLRSQNPTDKWIYVGSTDNLNRRLNEHNSGNVRSTKSRKPFNIIYKETFISEVEARKREKYFKFWNGRIEKKEILKNCEAK
jgi:putative endonuclease